MKNRLEFPQLLNQLGCQIGVELGTFKGEFSKHILENWQGSLYMIDVWRELNLEEYDDASNHINHWDAYKICIEMTKPFVERAHMIRMRGNVAKNLFSDNSLDFVYIDANHTYESVTEDIQDWYPKVKSGGILAGHDYLPSHIYNDDEKNKHIYLFEDGKPESSYYAGLFGVNCAVNEFCQQNSYQVNVTDEFLGTWFIIKK